MDKLKSEILKGMLVNDHELHELQKVILSAKKHDELKAEFLHMNDNELCEYVKKRYNDLKEDEKNAR